jgi:formylmethanofuran dehydrogenase subunit B
MVRPMAVTARRRGAVQGSQLERAVALLDRARLPVIGGLLTDIAGAEAAIALARKLDGVIDHAAGDGLARTTQIMREMGGNPASLGEARNRADIVVVVGKSPLERDPQLLETLFPSDEGLPRPGDNPRALILLGCGAGKVPNGIPATTVAPAKLDLSALILLLAAALQDRRIDDGETAAKLVSVAERLRQAAFPVFVVSPCDLDEHVLRTVLGMVRHLCLTTRAATLSIPAPGNGDGVNLCAAWTCGVPVRTRFTNGLPEHDPWRYAAQRLVESGEADALLWVDAIATRGVERPHGVPTVVLSASGDTAADVVIEVGCPGRDHDGALYLAKIDGIGMVKATHPNVRVPTVAKVLTGIAELIENREAVAC